jgi:2-amino-4-hydroxy-6-hydroxymethyldihydropteridine diphosphokinase
MVSFSFLCALRGFLFSVPSVVFSLENEAEFPLVVLGLGSNLGDSRLIVLDAIKALTSVLTELRAASLYETEPLHVTDQRRFINTAVAGFYPEPLAQGAYSAWKLLRRINEIEARFGRDRPRERRWGERTLDIDILLFGCLVLKKSGLEIPHPRLKERRFALEPLLELLPEAEEQGTGVSYRSVCDSLPEQGVRKGSKVIR